MASDRRSPSPRYSVLEAWGRRLPGTFSRAVLQASRLTAIRCQARRSTSFAARLALKGPLTTPVGGGFRSVNVRLREEFQLYANLRPAHTLVPGGRFENIDLVLVRENLEGLYVAFEHYIPVGDDPHAVAISSGVNTRAGSRRIVRFAFDHALQARPQESHHCPQGQRAEGADRHVPGGRRARLREEYEGRIAFDDRIVDACAMQLVLNPWQFDVIVTTNLFGDILSDLIAGLVGGLGAAPGANIGEKCAIFEAVHGSAPDIAGKGIANPTALLLAAGLMLDHVGHVDLAYRLRGAINAALNEDNIRTRDLGGTASTNEFAQAVSRRVSGQRFRETHRMTKGSDLLVAALENEGVEYIFGVPGEENLDVVESLRTSRIKLVLTRHEQSAASWRRPMGG